jgi:regulator of protease activity HflC (stomatin/prohibitin superfamily)
MAFAIGFVILRFIFGFFGVAAEYERAVIFRIGRYARTSGPGLFGMWPIIERRQKFDLRIATDSVDKQEAITKDNVPIKVDAVIWWQIVDPQKAALNVIDHRSSVIQTSLTKLRAGLGKNELRKILSDQETIAAELRASIDTVTEPWGVAVRDVEIKNVEIPESMQRAMAQVAEADREREARSIKAEAEKQAANAFAEAAATLAKTPGAMELRRLQTLQEIGAEQNTMTIIPMPVELLQLVGGLAQRLAPPPSSTIIPAPAQASSEAA